MNSLLMRVLLFIVSSTLQVTIVDAAEFIVPTEDPKNCVKANSTPCAVSTGDKPRMFLWDKSRYELDRNLVMTSEQLKKWSVYSGMLVVSSKKPLKIHTPFAEIYLEKSKVMIHVLENKVRILSLNGQGVRVTPKGEQNEQFLVPGFQNWYGGVEKGVADSGVASVIDFNEYSKARANFFMHHQLGFPKELERVASRVKWAAEKAASLHKDLFSRKMASLEEKHKEKVSKKRRKRQFNKYLRKLFLQKLRYDY